MNIVSRKSHLDDETNPFMMHDEYVDFFIVNHI